MENQEKKENNIIEKVIFYLGLLILLVLLGYLSFQWSTKENKPPSLEIVTTHDPSFDRYTFRVETKNTGAETAKSVNISFNLYQRGKLAESSVLEIDYVPVRSIEQGWVSFSKTRKPSDSLTIGSISFLKP